MTHEKTLAPLITPPTRPPEPTAEPTPLNIRDALTEQSWYLSDAGQPVMYAYIRHVVDAHPDPASVCPHPDCVAARQVEARAFEELLARLANDLT